MNAGIVEAISRWERAQAKLQAAIAEELDARAVLCSIAFPSPTFGINNAPLGDGRLLKAKFNQTYKLDRDTDKVEAQLKRLPAAIRANLVRWKPDLSVTAYKALEPAHKAVVNNVLTIKNSRPSLEIVIPKAT